MNLSLKLSDHIAQNRKERTDCFMCNNSGVYSSCESGSRINQTLITLCKAIHVQWNDTCPTVIPRICVCIKQVLLGWKLIFGYKVQWQQIHRTVEWFSTNQTLGDFLYPGFWLVENRCTVWCICCHWTLYPKINFLPIRTCLTHVQFRGITVGHVSISLDMCHFA